MLHVISGVEREDHEALLQSFGRLRYDVFVEKLGWSLPLVSTNEESDEYDSSSATYLMIANEVGVIVAGARLLNTARTSLLADKFSYLVDEGAPCSMFTFEVTRFVIDNRRSRIAGCGDLKTKLLWAIQAAALSLRAERLVSVSYTHLEPMLVKAGYRFRRLGKVFVVDGVATVALEHEVSAAVLQACEDRLSSSRAGSKRDMIGLSTCPSLSDFPARVSALSKGKPFDILRQTTA